MARNAKPARYVVTRYPGTVEVSGSAPSPQAPWQAREPRVGRAPWELQDPTPYGGGAAKTVGASGAAGGIGTGAGGSHVGGSGTGGATSGGATGNFGIPLLANTQTKTSASGGFANTPNGAHGKTPRPKKKLTWKRAVLAGVAGAGVLALAAAMALTLSHCDVATIGDEGYISPYNWDNLSTDDKGRLHYTDASGAPASMVGIDTSEWDTDTDWAAVAADGIEFAMVRIGYRGSSQGGLYVDERFEDSYAGATENGVLVGLYFFSQATTAEEGREEADFVLETLAGRKVDVAIAFDHEGIADPESRSYGLSDADYTAATQAFCSRIEHAGYTAAIYGNRYAIGKLSPEVRDLYNIWLAEWDTDLPHAKFDFCMWQFTNAGSVDGMWRRVDTSIWFTKELPLKTPASRAAAEADAGGEGGEGSETEPLDVTDAHHEAETGEGEAGAEGEGEEESGEEASPA